MTSEIIQITDWLADHKSSTLPGYLNRNPLLLAWIEHNTSQYVTKNIMERVYILLNGPQPRCEYGNVRQFNTFDLGYRKGCVLGNKCACVGKHRMLNQQKTLLDKYGVDSVSLIPGITEKRRITSLGKYGVDHYTKTNEYKTSASELVESRTAEDWQKIRDKTIQTNIEKYGASHHMKLEKQRDKVKGSNIEKYGTEFPLQNQSVKNKFVKTLQTRTIQQLSNIETKKQQTLMERYGVDAPSRIAMLPDTIAVLADPNNFSEFIRGKTRAEVVKELQIADHTLYLYAKQYAATELFARPNMSGLEIEVSEFLTENNIDFSQNDRSVISPLELDFYISDKNIAIEVCGLYWHSEKSADRGRQYHAKKHELCAARGITLITIFEDEWNNSRTIAERRLKHLLQISDADTIYARQCSVIEVDNKMAAQFLKTNHLQGTANSSIRLALIDKTGNIVSLMTFAKPRYSKIGDYEIVRFCSSCRVIGAAGKLFEFFKNQYTPETVISYSDNRWGDGIVYKHLGFEKTKTTVGYSYTDYRLRFSRDRFQKHKLVNEGFDPSMSEWQIMQQRGYDRIWDCGQSLWVYANHNKYTTSEIKG